MCSKALITFLDAVTKTVTRDISRRRVFQLTVWESHPAQWEGMATAGVSWPHCSHRQEAENKVKTEVAYGILSLAPSDPLSPVGQQLLSRSHNLLKTALLGWKGGSVCNVLALW